MAWKFDNDRPIYTQLLEKIEMKIISGEYKPGEKMPSVRELAAEASVNPNTMQKALAKLEENGLVVTSRTVGRTVTDDKELIGSARDIAAKRFTSEYITKMRRLGISVSQCVDIVDKMEIKE